MEKVYMCLQKYLTHQHPKQRKQKNKTFEKQTICAL